MYPALVKKIRHDAENEVLEEDRTFTGKLLSQAYFVLNLVL